MDEIWERAIETALEGETDCSSVRNLTLDGAVKCFQVRFPPPGLLEKFQNLEHLSIANAGVSSLENFPHLPKLQKLVLSDNRIAGGLEFLVQAGLDSLKDLDLSNNRIQFMEDLAPLSEIKLLSLDLYECPVTKIQDYRARVFGLIRSLKYLDKMDADENESLESDDEDDEDDDEEEMEEEEEDDDPGSGEVEGEFKSSKVSNGGNTDDGVLEVDEDEESDADEEETEVVTGEGGSTGLIHHPSNGFRVAPSRDDEEDDDDEEDEEDNMGEEIDEEDGEEEDVIEVHEVDVSDEDDDDDDDEDDDVEEVDDEEEEDVELANIGVLASTEGVIDGHDHEEEDDNGNIGEDEMLSIDEDGRYGDDDVEDEDGAEYLVQPTGQAEEEDVGGSDFDIDDEDDSGEEEEEVDDEGIENGSIPSTSFKRKRSEEEEDEEDDDLSGEEDDEGVQNGVLQSHPSTSSSQPKKKRNREDDEDEDEDEDSEEEDDDISMEAKFRRR